MNLGQIVKKYRDENSMSMDDFSKKSGLSKGYISMLEKNKNPRTGEPIVPSIDTINKVATALGVPFDEAFNMLGDQSVKISPREPSSNLSTVKNLYPIETRKFPLLGEIACDEPIFADEHFGSYLEAGADIQADFCLRAKGDSMVGARIHDGDIVFIRKQPDVENGEIAAVIIGDEATLKRIDKNVPGVIQLRPENPDYQVKIITLSNPNESKSVRIIGKAIAFQGDVK